MKRPLLDQVTRDLRLDRPATALALDLTGARPDAAAWRAFAARLLDAAGIAALGAGVIFFVAANWQDYGVMGRFAILQAAFAACVGFALWRPPPHLLGQSTLILAALLAGALLALFGQSYQTGADVYELFFAWAALTLPFALGARTGAQWAVWWVVLDVALTLYFGWLDPARMLWMGFDNKAISRSGLLMIPSIANLGGAALHAYLGHPRWLARMLQAIGFTFGTVACIAGLQRTSGQDLTVLASFAFIAAGIAAATLRSKRDVFPMALIAASAIAIVTAFLVRQLSFNDLGGFFVVSMWLVASSTAAGFLLMRWVRAWRA